MQGNNVGKKKIKDEEEETRIRDEISSMKTYFGK